MLPIDVFQDDQKYLSVIKKIPSESVFIDYKNQMRILYHCFHINSNNKIQKLIIKKFDMPNENIVFAK